MRVIICGAGRVGYGLATRLAVENNTVTIVDTSADLIRQITTDLDVRGVVGHGSHPDILVRAGIENADMIIAVTQYDEVNMVACQIAHSLFDVPTKVARVRAQAYLEAQYNDLYSRENMPIDIIISPEIEIGKAILRRLSTPGAFNVVPFADGLVQFLGVRIGEDCPIIDTPIRQIPDLFTGLHAAIVGIRRDGQLFAPNPDDPLEVGDDAYFVTRAEHATRLLEVVGTREAKARHVVIIGGGSIGTYVARALEDQSGVRVRVIEANKERAEIAATELPRTVILHGDAMNADVQEEAGSGKADMLICLTDDDKTNILSSILGKKLGARHTIALLNERPMQELQRDLDIDMIIDPRASTVSSILRHVRRGRILDVYMLNQGEAEVLEGEVMETSIFAGKTLREAGIDDGVAIGAIVRDGKVMMPEPTLMLKEGDRVVLLAERAALRDIEALFRVGVELY
ncbi:Trk system potassium transporter TrkA [Algimonas porphyrae]|uniref:Trk system potassium uptake protein TrkA n=1 Tax=Algimonas porphyrae TaxID=1128113 RepID=A0ABQ5UYC6_9PROT|nr:Trk system potassium transporter TrkA [Algimonas porphyrae]GLQ19371.1 Trk system potassium transport protein TrkA [Algimonas porphyrae]